LKRVHSSLNLVEIHHVKNLLEASGVRCTLRNQLLAGLAGFLDAARDRGFELVCDVPVGCAPIVDGRAQVVYGSRFRGSVKGMAWKNWIANKVLTATANFLYGSGITDEATAYKAFRSEVLNRLELSCVRFEFCPEVTAKLSRLGYRIWEIPVSYRGRQNTAGKKVRARDGFHALWTLVKCRFVAEETAWLSMPTSKNQSSYLMRKGAPATDPGRQLPARNRKGAETRNG